jgi:hypothetical protein
MTKNSCDETLPQIVKGDEFKSIKITPSKHLIDYLDIEIEITEDKIIITNNYGIDLETPIFFKECD